MSLEMTNFRYEWEPEMLERGMVVCSYTANLTLTMIEADHMVEGQDKFILLDQNMYYGQEYNPLELCQFLTGGRFIERSVYSAMIEAVRIEKE